MRNSRKHSVSPLQPTLFAASLDCDQQLRAVITEAIRRSPKSREQLAEEMSFLVGRNVTARMLYDFTSDSQVNHRFPAAWLPALAEVVGDDAPIEVILSKRALLRDLIALGRAVIEEEQSDRELGRRKEEFLRNHPGAGK